MPKSFLYKHYVIVVSAEFDDDTKFWVGKADISRRHNPKVLKTIIGPKARHTTAFDAEYFMASAARGWIENRKKRPDL